MIRPKSHWNVYRFDESQQLEVEQLAQSLQLSSLVAKLLAKRGYTTTQSAELFLHSNMEQLQDPFLLKDMAKAKARIEQALTNREKIRVFGDYDADGVSATTLMTYLLRELRADFDTYIPHRTREGYGLNNGAIDAAHQLGITLIVTVDTGISAVEQIAYANTLGIDVVVTDHHEPPDILPAAVAIVNPKQHDCPYPFKGLAGVGVAFKLAHALLGHPPLQWTDIVTLGTIADLMPLRGENRILVQQGLRQLAHTDKIGFRALADIAKMELTKMTATDVAFKIAPRINAAGRLEHANLALQLLCTTNMVEAEQLVVRLDSLNRERQQLVETMTNEAHAMWQAKCAQAKAQGQAEPHVIVVAASHWHVGVVGIVASKLVEKYYKPVIVLGIDEQLHKCKGSARSIAGYDIYAALKQCDELLAHYGGHPAAAGMTLSLDHLATFERRLHELAEQWMKPQDWLRVTNIDVSGEVRDLNLRLTEQLAQLEPYGNGNEMPMLHVKRAEVVQVQVVGKDKSHLKLTVSDERGELDVIGFGYAPYAKRIHAGTQLEMIGKLTEKEFNGQRKVSFELADLKSDDVHVVDLRDITSPLGMIGRLIERREFVAAGAVIVVPNDAWRGALAHILQQRSFNCPIVTYDQSPATSAQLADCHTLFVVGQPLSAQALSEVLAQCPKLETLYALYEQARQGITVPERETFAELYQQLRRRSAEFSQSNGLAQLLSGTLLSLTPSLVAFMVTVFAELQFLTIEHGGLHLVSSPPKRSLESAPSIGYRNEQTTADRMLYAPVKQLMAWVAQHCNPTIKERL